MSDWEWPLPVTQSESRIDLKKTDPRWPNIEKKSYNRAKNGPEDCV